jgi:hypothetical protein
VSYQYAAHALSALGLSDEAAAQIADPVGRCTRQPGCGDRRSGTACKLCRSRPINARIMSAEAYAALAELVDDDAQPLDEDARQRGSAGATISSRDYLVAHRKRPV